MTHVTNGLRGAGLALLLGLSVTTCRDSALGPGRGPRAVLSLAPVLPAEVSNLAAFGLAIDSLRVVVVRPATDTVVDTTVAFAVDQDSVSLALAIDLNANTETFEVTVQLRGGGFSLFSATSAVEVNEGGGNNNPPFEITNFVYEGPGAAVTSLVVTPLDSVIRLSDSLRFRVDAFSGPSPITQFYVSWSSSNAALAPINAHGVLRAPNQRGAVFVTATTPTGITATVPVTFVPVPTQVIAASTPPQNVLPGAALGPLRVRVLASDGLGVKGIPVTFTAVVGGGLVGSASVVTDSLGFAATSATAGVAGVNTFSATVAGVATPALFSITVLSTAGTQLVFSGPPGGAVTGVPFGAVVEIHDAQGALAATATNAVTLALGANPGSATLGGTLTVNAVGGIAVFSDLTLNLAGTGYTLVATSPGLTQAATPPFDVTAGFTGRLWINAAGGSWSNPANWSGGIVPGVTDTVHITTNGSYDVTLDVNVHVAVLFLGSGTGVQKLIGVSRTLQVDSTFTVNPGAELELTSSSLVGANGFFLNQGQVFLQSTAVAPDVFNSTGGFMLLRGTTTFGGTYTNNAGAVTRVEGDPFCCTASITVANGFLNAGQLQLTANNSGGTTAEITVTNGALSNAVGGTITSLPGTGGARYLYALLDNQGTLDVQQPLTINRSAANHTNSGTITLSGGDLTVIQSGTTPTFATSGSIVVGGGHVLSVSGGAFAYDNLAPGGLAGAGAIGFSSVVVDLATDLANDTLALSFVNAVVNGPGTLTNAPGRSFTVQNTTFNAPFVNQAVFVARGATTVAGGITTIAGSTIQIVGDPFCCIATLTVPGGFTNNGLIELTAINSGGTTSELSAPTGTIVNAPGGTIASVQGTGGARNLYAQLDNQGGLLVEHSLTISQPGADHQNSGLMQLTSGSLSLVQSGTTPSFTTSGAVEIGAGQSFAIQNGAFQYANAVPGGIGGTGSLSLNGVTWGLGTSFVHDTLSVSLVNAVVNGPGTFTNPPSRVLTVQNTTFNAGLVNQGTLLVRGATSLAGGLTTVALSTITVQGDPFCCIATLTVPGGFTNNGLLELTAVNSGGTTAEVSVPTGILVNAPTGTLASLPGTGGARNILARLDNQGTVVIGQDAVLSQPAAAHLNSGAIQLTSGNLSLIQSGTTPSFSTTGSVVVGAGRALSVTSGTFNYNNGAPGGLAGLGALNLNGVTLTLTPSFGNDTLGLSLVNAIVNGPGTLTNAAGRSLTAQSTSFNAPLVNKGTLVVRGATAVNGGITTDTASSMLIQGDPFCCIATLTVPGGFTNTGVIDLVAVNSGGTTSEISVPSGFLVNAPSGRIGLRVGTGGSRNVLAALNNQGIIEVEQSGALNAPSADHVNSGSIFLTNGDLSIVQSGTTPTFTTSGSLVVGPGRALSVTGGAFSYANTLPGGLGGRGAIAFNSTVVNLTPAFGNDSTTLSFVSSTVNGPGLFTNAAGRQLSIQSTAFNAPLINNGLLIARGASSLGGAMTASSSGIIRVEGDPLCCTAQLSVANPFTNDGLIELTAINSGGTTSGIDVAGGLTNGPGGTIALQPGTGGTRLLQTALTNQGQVIVAAPTTLGAANATHLNTGTIDVSGANLTIPLTGTPAVFTNQGTITVGAGRVAAVTGGAAGSFVNGTVGTLSGSGTFDVSATSFANDGNVAPGPSTSLLTFAGNYSMGSSAVLSVELGGPNIGTTYDHLALGTGAIGGTLNLTLVNGYVPTIGSSFTIVSGTALSGTFGLSNLPVVAGAAWQVLPTATAVTLSLIPAAQANLKTWAAGVSGNWSNPLSWLPTGVPAATDSVVIDALGTYTVTVDQAANAKFVNLGGPIGTGTRTLAVPGTTLTLAAGALIGQTGVVNLSGTLTGGGDIVVDGSMTWTAGTVSGVGFLTINAGATLNLSGGSRSLNTRSLRNNGQVLWTAGNISAVSAAISNAGTFSAQADGGLYFAGGSLPTFDNLATGSFERTLATGLLTIEAAFNNAGNFDVQSGFVELTRGGSSSVDYAVAAGAVLRFGGGTHTLATGTDLAGGGAFELSGPAVLDLTTADTLNVARFHQIGGTLQGAGTLQADSLIWFAGLQQGTGVTRIPIGGVLVLNGTTVNWNRTLINEGTILWTAGTIAGGSVTLQNSGVIFMAAPSGSMTWNTGPTPPVLDNQGSLLRSGGLGIVTLNVFLNNDGGLDVQSGMLSLDRGGAGKGQYVVSNPAATLRFGGVGAHNLSSGARVLGEGLFTFTGADLSLTGAGSVYDVNGTTQVLAGVIDLSPGDTARFGNLELGGGFLKGSAPLVVNGAATWTGGTLDGDPGTALIIPSVSSLRIDEAATKFLSNRQIIASGPVLWNKGPVVINGGAVLDIQPSNTFDVVSLDDWQGNGAIEIRDRAIMTVASPGAVAIGPGTALNVAGTLDIQAGSTVKMTGDFALLGSGILTGNGTLDVASAGKPPVNQGTVKPGTSPGVLTILGDWEQPLGSVLEIDVFGPFDKPTDFDQFNVSGTFSRGPAIQEQGGILRLVGNGSFDTPSGSYVISSVGAHAGPQFVVQVVNLPPPRSVDYQDPKKIIVTW